MDEDRRPSGGESARDGGADAARAAHDEGAAAGSLELEERPD